MLWRSMIAVGLISRRENNADSGTYILVISGEFNSISSGFTVEVIVVVDVVVLISSYYGDAAASQIEILMLYSKRT